MRSNSPSSTQLPPKVCGRRTRPGLVLGLGVAVFALGIGGWRQ